MKMRNIFSVLVNAGLLINPLVLRAETHETLQQTFGQEPEAELDENSDDDESATEDSSAEIEKMLKAERGGVQLVAGKDRQGNPVYVGFDFDHFFSTTVKSVDGKSSLEIFHGYSPEKSPFIFFIQKEEDHDSILALPMRLSSNAQPGMTRESEDLLKKETQENISKLINTQIASAEQKIENLPKEIKATTQKIEKQQKDLDKKTQEIIALDLPKNSYIPSPLRISSIMLSQNDLFDEIRMAQHELAENSQILNSPDEMKKLREFVDQQISEVKSLEKKVSEISETDSLGDFSKKIAQMIKPAKPGNFPKSDSSGITYSFKDGGLVFMKSTTSGSKEVLVLDKKTLEIAKTFGKDVAVLDKLTFKQAYASDDEDHADDDNDAADKKPEPGQTDQDILDALEGPKTPASGAQTPVHPEQKKQQDSQPNKDQFQ